MLYVTKKSNMFLLAILMAAVLACNHAKHREYPVTPPSVDFPEKGWEMFSTPRNFDHPGTVYGVKKDGVKKIIDILNIKKPKPKEEEFPVVTYMEERKIGIGTLIQFIKADTSANIDISVDDQRKVAVKMKIEGAQRYELTDMNLKDMLRNISIQIKKEGIEYDSYNVIRGVVSAKNISYKFDIDDLKHYGIDLKAFDRFSAHAGYSWNINREYQLERKFNTPMNIFYLSEPFSTEKYLPILKITEFKLLNELYVDQSKALPVLTALHPRPSTDFRYNHDPTKLLLAFGFVVDNFIMQDRSKIALNGTIAIQDSEGHELGNTSLPPFTNIEDWKKMPNVKRIGVQNVCRFFNIQCQNSFQIVYIVIVDKFELHQIPKNQGKLVISIEDALSGKRAKEQYPIQVITE